MHCRLDLTPWQPKPSSLPLAPAPTDAAVCGGGDVRVGRVLGADGEGLGAVEGQHLGGGHQRAALKHHRRHRLPVLVPAAAGRGQGGVKGGVRGEGGCMKRV